MSECITVENVVVVVKQKRGRKSKKDLLAAAEKLNNSILNNINNSSNINNITCLIEDNTDNADTTNNTNLINEIINNTDDVKIELPPTEKPGAKKRGRKPKGGKIIQQVVSLNDNKESKPNIILHLKCSMNDLQSTTINTNIESFNFASCKNEISYEIIGDDILNVQSVPSVTNNANSSSNNSNPSSNSSNFSNNNFSSNLTNNSNSKIYDDKFNYNNDDDNDGLCPTKEVETRELWKKLKQLEHNLHINNISNKKSACFWCTCDFDSPPVYIPKFQIKDSYHVYGCFCSPECSTAYLMEENIDSSTKFERYHLINHIYSKIYNYTKNIKPSPNPYYMLDKYYGNLSIQEYRSLLRNERLFLIVDKPLTRILPELHEDNDDFIINNKIIPSNTYQIKKTVHKKPQTKNNIMNEKFGLIQ